jgi:hypothetical protein
MNWVLTITLAAGLSASNAATRSENPTTESTSAARETTQPPKAQAKNSSNTATGGSHNNKPHRTGSSTDTTGALERKKHLLSTLPTSPSGDSSPHKVVIKKGGVPEPLTQIVTDMAPAEATKKRSESERLLDSADDDLKRLAGRTLNEQEEETVSQIDHYMTVARSALKEGDISRGHTLAMKANLLAADVAKHQ